MDTINSYIISDVSGGMKVYIQRFCSELLFNKLKKEANQDYVQGKPPVLQDYYHSVLQLFNMLHKFAITTLKGLEQVKLASEYLRKTKQKHKSKILDSFDNALEKADDLMCYMEDIRNNLEIDDCMDRERDKMENIFQDDEDD